MTTDDNALGIKLYLVCACKSYDKKQENVAPLMTGICIGFKPYVVIKMYCLHVDEVERVFSLNVCRGRITGRWRGRSSLPFFKN